MSKINYLKGDATQPVGLGVKIIVHVCNDIGAWGAGFVLAISKKWSSPKKHYKNWFVNQNDFNLGEVQFVDVEDDIIVANLIGQKGVRNKKNLRPIRYEAVESGLIKVVKYASENECSIHMPRIGCGLAGGSWSVIESIIEKTLVSNNLDVFVYDL